MGIYMSSHAMIGVTFVPNDKEVETKKRGCSHVGSDMSFCAECGSPMWKDGVRHEHQFEYIHEEFLEPVLEKLVECFDGYAVVAEPYGGEKYYIGYGATVENHEDAKIPLIDYEHIKADLQEVLEEFGVWDQCKDSFGLWAISTGN